MNDDKQYGYRFYDGPACFGPLPKDTVQAKLDDDLAAIPVERRRMFLGGWSKWVDSDDFKDTP